MRFQFPFKGHYRLTQTYAQNANNYVGGHHGGLDIVPLEGNALTGGPFPDNIYPLFEGETVSISDTDIARGKGIKVKSVFNTDLHSHFTKYLKSKNLLPQNFNGDFYLEHFYWHCLEVLDKDGQVDKKTSIAKAGNTGWVFSGGQQVPDNQKGVPPYPGLHLHLETVLGTSNQVFNLDKDFKGRINPQDILDYKDNEMDILNITGESTLVIENSEGKFYEIATDPKLYPVVQKILGLPNDAALNSVSRQKVNSHYGGKATMGEVFDKNGKAIPGLTFTNK